MDFPDPTLLAAGFVGAFQMLPAEARGLRLARFRWLPRRPESALTDSRGTRPHGARMTKKSGLMRNQDRPTVFGVELDRVNLLPVRNYVDVERAGDHGADPLGDGTFRMVPSGDIVSFEERCRRLKR